MLPTVAYAFFEYNTYGTSTDSSGNQIVAEPVKNNLKNVKISLMMNYNLYSKRRSDVLPFLQVGAGLNGGFPTLFTGLGGRIRAGKSKLAISGGLAMSWIQELNSLSVGDVVSGTDDINKDLSYQFSGVKPYIGVHYSF